METVIFDYRKVRKTRQNPTATVELGPWLDLAANYKRIYDMRLFYVIKPAADNIVKFGVAGLTGKSSGWGRLHQYINEYGFRDELNICSGVDLLYLAGTKYNKDVETVNTRVWQKEAACKRYFRDEALRGRGFERIEQHRLDALFKIVDDKSNKLFEDIETERRTSERLQQAELLDTDKIVRIISHVTLGGKSRALTKYKVQWNRPYTLTSQKQLKGKTLDEDRTETTTVTDDTTKEFYKNIILFRNGGQAIAAYKILHPNGVFRD